MTSADFSAIPTRGYRGRAHPLRGSLRQMSTGHLVLLRKTPLVNPGNCIFFQWIPAASTLIRTLNLGLQYGVPSYPLIKPHMQFLFVSTHFCSLASFRLDLIGQHPPQCCGAGIATCYGSRQPAMQSSYFRVTPAHKGLTPSR